jgi:hypothetical protein
MRGRRGAESEVAAILSLVESCRSLKIRVRDYFAAMLPGFVEVAIQRQTSLTVAA